MEWRSKGKRQGPKNVNKEKKQFKKNVSLYTGKYIF